MLSVCKGPQQLRASCMHGAMLMEGNKMLLLTLFARDAHVCSVMVGRLECPHKSTKFGAQRLGPKPRGYHAVTCMLLCTSVPMLCAQRDCMHGVQASPACQAVSDACADAGRGACIAPTSCCSGMQCMGLASCMHCVNKRQGSGHTPRSSCTLTSKERRPGLQAVTRCAHVV